jgi:hypothetical protein
MTPSRPAPSFQRGIPDLEFIKRHVPITNVARALDMCVIGNRAHCWRPHSHQHGDRTPSVWFSRRSNKGKCFVCDHFTWSNVDLVQRVIGCSTAHAINWIAARFDVPRIAKRRPTTNRIVAPGRVGCGSQVQDFMRSGLFAALPHATKALLFVLHEFMDWQQLSYRTLMRLSGIGSRATIKVSLENLKHVGLLKVERGYTGRGVCEINAYRLTWDDARLQLLMAERHQATIREIKAEQELREAERAGQRANLGKHQYTC